MKKLITLLVLGLVLTSCGSQYQLSTLNHEPEYIGDVRVDIIDNEFQLARKLRTDDRFRWDFAQYAMNQDMRWNYDFYFSNRMYRSGFDSPFSFQWNSHQYWWNWANNSHFNMGFNHWDPFGFNNYGMGWSYSWNNRRWSSNQWGNGYGWNNNGWNNGYQRGSNVAYHSGRRGSSNVIVGKTTNVIKDRVIISRNNPRIVNNTDVVIDKELIKLKRNNPNIRVIRNTNNNSKPIRNYNRIENNSNNNINRNNNNTIPINNSRPVRTYTPPTRSTTPVRTNGNTNVIRGGKPNVKR